MDYSEGSISTVDMQFIPKEGQLVAGPFLNEPMLVETVRPGGLTTLLAATR